MLLFAAAHFPCPQQRDQHANGNPVHAAPRARPPRRRPLSTDATPSSSSSPPPQKQQLELGFPPPPPPQRGPISAASNLAGNDGSSGGGGGGDGDGGEPATAAAAAPGVTVDPGVSEDEAAPSFRRSDDVAERVGGDSRVVRDGYGPGASSWDDAWDVDGIGSAPSHGGDAGSPIGTQLGTQLGSTARLAGSGSGSGGAGGEGAGRGGRGSGVERVDVSNGEAEAQGGPKEEVKASRPGDERAHKMWVTGAGAGDSVSGEMGRMAAGVAGRQSGAVGFVRLPSQLFSYLVFLVPFSFDVMLEQNAPNTGVPFPSVVQDGHTSCN